MVWIMKLSALMLLSSFLGASARVVRIETPNDYNYAYLSDHGVNIKGRTNISFLLRAANDGHVALSREKYNWNTHSYEIVLGGWKNQRSAIRRCDQCVAKVSYDHEPLNASELMPFWISWDRGNIRVGSGRRLFNHQFLQWQDSDPETVNHVGFSTGWGSNGTWILGAVDGGWSTWAAWSECSTSCEGGTRTRKRACNDPLPAYGEDCAGFWLEEGRCNDFPCAVDGSWSSWGTFGACSATCADGFRSRFRSCDSPPPQDGGAPCPGPGEDKETCRDKECPVDGGWSEWTPWTSCSKDCGTGEVTKRRLCDSPPPQHGGMRCVGKAIESKTCFVMECAVDGGWSDWSDWSPCSSSCSEGNITRSRDCNQPIPAHGGADCDGPQAEHLPCNAGPCPVAGGWSEWTVWEPCTLSCRNGSRSRIRFCDAPPPQYGGDDCAGADVVTTSCNTFPCPVDGGWTSWGAWTPCTASCGTGTYSRTRRCTAPTPSAGGARCRGASFQQQDCLDVECPVDGRWSQWTTWSQCSHSCGPGHAQRSRDCNRPEPRFGGFNCSGDWLDIEECLVTYCPVDGGFTDWSPWSQCSATCGPGLMTKARWCIFPRPQYGGRPCEGEMTNETSCMDNYCPIDGGWSSWGPWDTCTVTCEGGTRVRYRTCTSPPSQYGGQECEGVGLLNETCNIQHCPVPIGWAPWGTWTECSVTCGGGYMARTRQCEDPDVLNCIGSHVQNWTCAFVDCPDKWVYIAEVEPVDAPGAVGIGVMAIVFMSLIPAICLIIDITSLPTHIRYARRNLRDFKKTWAEYRARKAGGGEEVRYSPTGNTRPPAPSPVPQTSGTGNAVTGSGLSGSVSGDASPDGSAAGSPVRPPAYDNPGLEVHENDLGLKVNHNDIGLKVNQDGGRMGNHFDRISPILAASVGNHVGNEIHANHTPIIRDFDGRFDLGTPGMDRGTMTTY